MRHKGDYIVAVKSFFNLKGGIDKQNQLNKDLILKK